jgi:non-canonical purine NTP pyrophosphatase (RdgB/HAM1 family)
MRKIVLASRNADKVRELKQLFAGLGFEILCSDDFPGLPEVIEDGTTIVGNARRKALVTAAYTGEIAVADDTSLEVRELNGFPDVFAARFSGSGATYASNAKLLLELMDGVPEGARQARFNTGCAWVDPRPDRDSYQVLAPAQMRWLRNPWGRGLTYPDPEGEWDYWNSLVDRRDVWHTYRRAMESDLAGWGHDKDRLREVARGLFAGCPDALYPGEKLDTSLAEEGMRLPDSRIWAVTGPATTEEPLTRYAPSGLPADNAGLNSCGPFWLEITAVGKILGRITEQPIGRGGFGYDPVFRPETDSRTLAEMPAEAKNGISHRGRAMRRLMRAVRGAYKG